MRKNGRNFVLLNQQFFLQQAFTDERYNIVIRLLEMDCEGTSEKTTQHDRNTNELIMGHSQEKAEGENGEDEHQQESSSSDSYDYYADDTPLPKAQPFDLKKNWLSNTDEVLKKFEDKLTEIKKEQKGIQEGFKLFSENEKKYKLSSLRKIIISLDKKQIYDEYLLKTRRTFEKLSPALLMNIFSYADAHLFYFITKARKVSKIFNEIYLNEPIQYFLAEKDFLYEGDECNALKESISMCKKYILFHKTFQYYKDMQYTEQIPQNSIKNDLEGAVEFINSIHKIVHGKQNRDFNYYSLMNTFMKKNRVVIGLSSLSLTSLVMVRKPAIIAFSNYLAFNRSERSREQITKTKYSKVIAVVEYEDYRDSLVINTKVSNYMWDVYGLNFAVIVSPHFTPTILPTKVWNFLIFHPRNQLKTTYLSDIELEEGRFSSARIDLRFTQKMEECQFSTIEYQSWVKMQGKVKPMITIISPPQPKKMLSEHEQPRDEDLEEYFSFCLFYRMEDYYLIAFPQEFL